MTIDEKCTEIVRKIVEICHSGPAGYIPGPAVTFADDFAGQGITVGIGLCMHSHITDFNTNEFDFYAFVGRLHKFLMGIDYEEWLKTKEFPKDKDLPL